MPNPLYPTLLRAPETKFFRTLQGVWQTDPFLSPVVRKWSFLEGEGDPFAGDGDDFDFDSPKANPDSFPAVRAYVKGEENRAAANDRNEANLQVGVQIWTGGTHQDDMWNLWNTLRLALRPRESYGYDAGRYEEVQALFRNVRGFGSVWDVAGIAQPRPENTARNYLTAAGMFVFHILVPY